MNNLTNRVAAATVTVMLALSLLSGCGDDADDGGTKTDATAAQRVRDAVDTTLGLDSFTIDSKAELQIQQQQLEMTIAGSVDYADVVGDVTMRVDQSGQAGDVHILIDGQNAWVSASGTGVPELPDGTEWVHGDAERLSSAPSFTQTGLIGVVLVLRGAEDVRSEGSDEIDGQSVERYSTSLTYQEALDAAGDDAEAFKSSFSLTGQATSSTLHVTVALDDDGVIRELAIDIDSDFPVDGTFSLTVDDPNGEVAKPDAPDSATVATGPEGDALFEQMLS